MWPITAYVTLKNSEEKIVTKKPLSQINQELGIYANNGNRLVEGVDITDKDMMVLGIISGLSMDQQNRMRLLSI